MESKHNINKIFFIFKEIHKTSSTSTTTTNKLFICRYPNCNKKYYHQNRIVIHLRTHVGKKPFLCQFCGKLFNERGNLKTHLRIHTGERPYKCDFQGCTSAFKAFGHLRDHKKIHFNIRPFKCEFCLKSFSRSGVLKIHRSIHTGERQYQCEVCTKKFSEKGNLKQHLKVHFKTQCETDASVCLKKSVSDGETLCTVDSNKNAKDIDYLFYNGNDNPEMNNEQVNSSIKIFDCEMTENNPSENNEQSYYSDLYQNVDYNNQFSSSRNLFFNESKDIFCFSDYSQRFTFH